MMNETKKTFKKLATASLFGVLVLSSASALARPTGTLTWSERGNAPFSDGDTYITYMSWQGAQGTTWVWRWQKVYQKFTLFCSAPSCSSEANETRSESIATQVGFDVSAAGGGYTGLIPTLKAAYSRTFTTTNTFGYSWRATVGPGVNVYGGMIALDKYVPAADIRGVWNPTGATRSVGCSRAGCGTERQFRWDNDQTIGTWKGHQITQHRTFVCSTRTTLTPAVGQGLPAGCRAPDIPY